MLVKFDKHLAQINCYTCMQNFVYKAERLIVNYANWWKASSIVSFLVIHVIKKMKDYTSALLSTQNPHNKMHTSVRKLDIFEFLYFNQNST